MTINSEPSSRLRHFATVAHIKRDGCVGHAKANGFQTMISRRKLLSFSIWGMGLIGAGAAGHVLLSVGRRVPYNASDFVEVELGPIGPGKNVAIELSGERIMVRHLNQMEYDRANAGDIALFPDSLSRNASLDGNALATNANRMLKTNGRHVAVVLKCANDGCVPIAGAGNHAGWFCPCCSSHYDALGRVRSGPALKNLAVPRVEIPAPGKVYLRL